MFLDNTSTASPIMAEDGHCQNDGCPNSLEFINLPENSDPDRHLLIGCGNQYDCLKHAPSHAQDLLQFVLEPLPPFDIDNLPGRRNKTIVI